MKKTNFFFLLLLPLCLAACGTEQKISPTEIETIYQTQLQTLSTIVQSFFPPTTSQALHTTTNLEVNTQDTLNGHLVYTSDKYSDVTPAEETTWQGGKAEKATNTFDFSLQNRSEAAPISFSGIVNTLYTGQIMHFNIQHFNIFMGEEDATTNNFINLLAKDLAGKWIALDKEENFWISVIETPELSEFFSDFVQLFLVDEVQVATLASDIPTSEMLLPVPNLASPQHLLSAQRFYTFWTQLLDIPLSLDNLTLNPEKESSITYQLQKNRQVTMTKTLYYRTDTHTFTVLLSFNPEKLSFTIKDIMDVTNPESPRSEIFTLTITPENNHTFKLSLSLEQETQQIGVLETKINLKKSDTTTQIDVQGNLQLQIDQLNLDDALNLHFQGNQTLTPTSAPDFSLTWESIALSDLL